MSKGPKVQETSQESRTNHEPHDSVVVSTEADLMGDVSLEVSVQPGTFDSFEALCAANRERTLYLSDGKGGVLMIPDEWCDDFPQDETADEDNPEIYGYDSDLATECYNCHALYTQWIPFSSIRDCIEVSEQEARQINPKLFEMIDAINME